MLEEGPRPDPVQALIPTAMIDTALFYFFTL